jgi:hypothetical protein
VRLLKADALLALFGQHHPRRGGWEGRSDASGFGVSAGGDNRRTSLCADPEAD